VHPADVAEYVADSVQALRERLRACPGLLANEPVLEHGTDLYIGFVKIERRLLRQAVSIGLEVPGGGTALRVHQVPDLGVPPVRRELILRMDLTDYDGQPPTAELLLPDRSPLPAEQWPKELGNQGIVRGHPEYGRPFFCRRGLREYHSHPRHEDDPWDRHREELTLHALVLELLLDLRDRWIVT
jgi:hypothetical protein